MFSCEYSEISQKTYFEEHLRTAASDVTLGSDSLGLSFWRDPFKTILTQQYYTNNSRFQTKALKCNSAHMPSLNLTHRLSFEPRICMFIVNVLSANVTKWSNTLKQFVANFPTNCLSVFDHFLGLTLEGLTVVTGKANACNPWTSCFQIMVIVINIHSIC